MKIFIIAILTIFLCSCDQVENLKTNTENLLQDTLEQAEQKLEETKHKVKQIKAIF